MTQKCFDKIHWCILVAIVIGICVAGLVGLLMTAQTVPIILIEVLIGCVLLNTTIVLILNIHSWHNGK